MIASWMSYAFLVALLVAIAGIAFEHVAIGQRWPRRAVWMTAFAVSIAWPVVSMTNAWLGVGRTAATLMPFTITVDPSRMVTGQSVPSDLASRVDTMLLTLWGLLTVAFLIRLARGVRMVRTTRAQWTHGEIDGTPVRLSTNVGPAVVGVRSMDVVVPDWVLALDAPLRTIVLRHEEEHRSARDPLLLLAAAIGVALMPWNLPLWWQARRLRLAIEMDCDARVLRLHPFPERYGLLMLAIAQRRSVAPTLFAPMLSEPTTQLERRIRAMQTIPRRLGRLTMFGGAAVAVSVLALACSLASDAPTRATKTGETAASQHSNSLTTAPVRVTDDQVMRDFQVEHRASPLRGQTAPQYPAALRQAGVEGEVLVQFVVGKDGMVDTSTIKVLKSSHGLFTQAVREALTTIRFNPATVGGAPVKQLVQMPFAFQLHR